MRTPKIRQFSLTQPAGLALAALLTFAPLAGAQICAPTADDLVFEQMTFIAGLAVPPGIQNTLYNELQDALVGIAEGDVEAAVAALEDFSDRVENQSGGQIDPADADLLLAAAASAVQLLTEVTCPCPAAIPEFAAFLADPANIGGCSPENEFVSVSLYELTATGVGEVITVNGHPDYAEFSSCRYRDFGGGGPVTEVSITYEEAEACSQLLYDATAAAGVACSAAP